ncbi:MAG: hypothetical protein ACRDGA_08855, partial [Bacteroidota bacterium]
MLPPELQKVSFTCPACKKALSLTLDVVFKRASVECFHCKRVIEFEGPVVARALQSVSDVEKKAVQIAEVRADYSKTVERFKAAVSDLLKSARIAS